MSDGNSILAILIPFAALRPVRTLPQIVFFILGVITDNLWRKLAKQLGDFRLGLDLFLYFLLIEDVGDADVAVGQVEKRPLRSLAL